LEKGHNGRYYSEDITVIEKKKVIRLRTELETKTIITEIYMRHYNRLYFNLKVSKNNFNSATGCPMGSRISVLYVQSTGHGTDHSHPNTAEVINS
jgi:hypothetical protein